MAEKKYYWLRLQADRLNVGGDLDFLLAQKNGAEYVALYFLLCAQTINTNGEMISQLGDMIIPFDIDTITRNCRHFSRDTVIVALELYKRLGLVYEQDNKILKIAKYDELVGSCCEDEYSRRLHVERQRKYREKQKMLESPSVTVTEDVTVTQSSSVDVENREKSLENRDKDIRNNNVSCSTQKRFVKPTLEEVVNYCKERRNTVDANKFFDYYESNGWQVGKNKMKDWQAAVRTWERNAYGGNTQKTADERLGIAGDSQAYFDILLGNNTNNDNDDEEMPF